jgi:hypothetical protein
MMTVEDLFNLFSSEDNILKKDKLPILDFTDHPVYWVGMFTKILTNHKGFDDYIKNIFININPEISLDKSEELGEWILYNKAWYYIEKLDISIPFHAENLFLGSTPNTIPALNMAISYFENLEEYEKCSHLAKIKTELENILE